jgi:hypothetical protein
MTTNRWYYRGGSHQWNRQNPNFRVKPSNGTTISFISRRTCMEGIQRRAGSLAAATVIDALMPNYALGQQVSRNDDRIKATYLPSPQGNGNIKGYLVRPISADTRCETVTKLPGVIVVHENRGLNPLPTTRRSICKALHT